MSKNFIVLDISKIFLEATHVVGLTRMSNVKIKGMVKHQLDWDDFKEIWTLQRWGKNHPFVYDYIASAKKIIDGFGFSIIHSKFYYLGEDEPLVISFGDYDIDDPYVICIAPRMFKGDVKE